MSLPVPAAVSKCASCNADDVKLYNCASCKVVQYCRVPCQKAHYESIMNRRVYYFVSQVQPTIVLFVSSPCLSQTAAGCSLRAAGMAPIRGVT
jgi:hypothetical protein